jgi:hypothetical protein
MDFVSRVNSTLWQKGHCKHKDVMQQNQTTAEQEQEVVNMHGQPAAMHAPSDHLVLQPYLGPWHCCTS